MLVSQPPVPSNVALLRDRVSAEVMRLKCGWLVGSALIQRDWWPERQKIWTQGPTEKEDDVN